jgi:hypothetical protein
MVSRVGQITTPASQNQKKKSSRYELALASDATNVVAPPCMHRSSQCVLALVALDVLVAQICWLWSLAALHTRRSVNGEREA